MASKTTRTKKVATSDVEPKVDKIKNGAAKAVDEEVDDMLVQKVREAVKEVIEEELDARLDKAVAELARGVRELLREDWLQKTAQLGTLIEMLKHIQELLKSAPKKAPARAAAATGAKTKAGAAAKITVPNTRDKYFEELAKRDPSFLDEYLACEDIKGAVDAIADVFEDKTEEGIVIEKCKAIYKYMKNNTKKPHIKQLFDAFAEKYKEDKKAANAKNQRADEKEEAD
jgi:hypothetical protein